MTPFSLEGKVAVITGSGSGIGQAIAKVFGTQGASVCVMDVNESAAAKTAEEISSAGGKAMFRQCDVSDHLQAATVINEFASKFGTIDILVNCAGIAQVANLEKTSEADFEKIFRVNVKGTYNTMHAVISYMRKQKKGAIVNLASTAATVGIPDRFAYSMSKGAVYSMTLSVAKDFVQEGIRCNSISPGRVHTPFVDGFIKANYAGREAEMFEKLSKTQPIGRMGKPEEIAWLALYLVSDEASFVTGSDYTIDGGFIKLNN